MTPLDNITIPAHTLRMRQAALHELQHAAEQARGSRRALRDGQRRGRRGRGAAADPGAKSWRTRYAFRPRQLSAVALPAGGRRPDPHIRSG